MRGWRKLRTLLLAVCLLAALCVSSAAVTDPILWTSEDGLYTLKLIENSEGGLSVMGCSTEETTLGDLVIPSEVDGVPVTRITYAALRYATAFTGDVILPETLTHIGDRAFFECVNLTGELHLPSGLVSVGEEAFSDCKNLTGGLVFSEQIQLIGEDAFKRCSGLDGELVLPAAVSDTLVIGEDAFYECSNLKSPAGQDFVIPEGTTTLALRAFYGCKSLIGGLVLPESLTTWEGSVFSGCSGFDGQLIIPDHVTSIPYSSFYRCSGLMGELRIPAGVTSIGNYAFSGCSGFTGELRIPAGVTTIGDYAFSSCSGFSGNLKLPEGLTEIAEKSFFRCSGFTGQLKLPAGVTVIGEYAFSECTGFTGKLNLPDNLLAIDTGAFCACTGLSGILYIPDSVLYIYNKAFCDCSGFEGLILPDAPVYFGDEAFKNCSSMTGPLVIAEGTDTIRHNVFENCSGFTSLTLPDSVTFIGVSAFANCSGLTGELILPSNLTDLCGSAFENCSGLTGDLILPQGLEEVGSEAFLKCSGLDGMIKIPYSVRRIGSFSFADCSNVREIYLPPNVEIWDRDRPPFDECSSIEDVYVGGGEDDRYPSLSTISKSLVHYNSYPAKELTIYGGSNLSYRVGQTVTLEASYAANEIAEDLSFSWSSSHPEVVKLVDSTVQVRGKGYAAKVTATFEILKESSSEITVSGPFGLKDTCVVSGDDLKTLTFVPQNGQSAAEPTELEPGETTQLLFSYRSFSPVAEDLDKFTWKTLVDGVEQSGIVSVSNVNVTADGEFAATLTATVTALDYGGPVDIVVSGPGKSSAGCSVVVSMDTLTIVGESWPAEDDPESVRSLRGKVAEPLTVYVRYETEREDAAAEEILNNLIWTSSTPDFFGCGDNEHSIGTDEKFEPEVSWEKVSDGIYRLKLELTPAQEGATALKVETAADENGRTFSDACPFFAVFDVDSYLVELYGRTDNGARLPQAEGLDEYLYKRDTPSSLIVDELEKTTGFIGFTGVWEGLEVAYSTLDNPAAAYMKYSVRESDIYYALILELLRGTLEEYSHLAAVQATAFGNEMSSTVQDAVLVISKVDLTKSGVFSDWLKDNNDLLSMDIYKDKMDIPGLLGDFFAAANVFTGTVDDYGQAMSDAAVVEQVTDAMERVLEVMLAECPAKEENLQEALTNCLEQVRKTGDELRQDAELGLVFSAGKRGYAAIFDKMWDEMMVNVKWSNPWVAAFSAAYSISSTVTKELCNTDDTLETYYKMLAMEDIREVAQKATDTMAFIWKEDPGAASAAEYLCALDMLYRIQSEDVELARDAAQALMDSPLYGIKADPEKMEAALADFNTYNTGLDNTYRVFREMWMTYFHEDYPDALLDLQYEDLFTEASGMRPVRVVVVACPVSVQVLDRYGKEAAYVGRDRIGSNTDAVSVALIGEEKHIYLYGSGYTLRYEGYDEGTMDVTDRTYNPDGTVKQELQYRDLPVKAGETYKAGQTGNLRNPGGSYVAPDVDSGDYAWTLTVENGAAEINGLPVVTGQVHEGVLVPLTALDAVDGRPFLGWTSTVGEEIFADPASPATTVVMPGRDVVITAVYGQPKPEIAGELELTGGSGEALDAIPAEAFTAKVPMPEEAVRGLLAAYDMGGKLVWIGEGAVADGICTFTADNTDGDMAELRFFALTEQNAPAQKIVVFPKK